jgi:DNA-binding NtrC family response regulator
MKEGTALENQSFLNSMPERGPMDHNGKLLLVEDDRTLMKCLQRCLHKDGWEVTGVASVEEATRHLVKRDFDLVVTDYHLSTINGGQPPI